MLALSLSLAQYSPAGLATVSSPTRKEIDAPAAQC
jgi:hypothetical protein